MNYWIRQPNIYKKMAGKDRLHCDSRATSDIVKHISIENIIK
jgi:hypothetical protein